MPYVLLYTPVHCAYEGVQALQRYILALSALFFVRAIEDYERKITSVVRIIAQKYSHVSEQVKQLCNPLAAVMVIHTGIGNHPRTHSFTYKQPFSLCRFQQITPRVSSTRSRHEKTGCWAYTTHRAQTKYIGALLSYNPAALPNTIRFWRALSLVEQRRHATL